MLKCQKSYRITFLIALLIVCMLILSGCFSLKGKETGIPAENFTLPDLEGKNISLADYKGKNVLLNFWASWCGPCKEEMPAIQKFHEEYKDKGLVVLTVNPGDDKATIDTFMNSNKYTFPVLVDTNRDVAKKYNTSNIPVTFIVNKEGTIVFKKVGLITGEEIQKALEAVK